MASMPGRTNWTRPMLTRLLELHYQGLNDRQITGELQKEFDGVPEYIGETKAELMFLKSGMYPHLAFPVALFLPSPSPSKVRDKGCS